MNERSFLFSRYCRTPTRSLREIEASLEQDFFIRGHRSYHVNLRIPSRIDTLANNIIVSVPDQYSLRAGANFNIKKWILSAGLRNEGIPVHDLFGRSEGIRRAGDNLSVESGVIYKMKNATVYAYVPFIVSRKIKQNLPDRFKTDYSGVYTITSGGSGNYQVFLGVQFKF